MSEFVKGGKAWGQKFRTPLRNIYDSDGEFLMSELIKQEGVRKEFTFTDKDERLLKQTHKVVTLSGKVLVDVPENDEDDEDLELDSINSSRSTNKRRSLEVQAKVAEIGIKMGFKVWVPRNDKSGVFSFIHNSVKSNFLDELPLNYDGSTIRTIEQIDVIWLKGRSMARAFEVEHTTAVYSGLLRMADLLALQPNMDIRLHIVAPDEKREKVLRELRRPVFTLLDRGPLYKQCTYLSYDSVEQLESTFHLTHMNDSIIEEYEESAED